MPAFAYQADASQANVPEEEVGQRSREEQKPAGQQGATRSGPGRLSGWAQVKVLTINVTGSKESLTWAMTQEVQIILLQEHKALSAHLPAWQALAKRHGWKGVWEAAIKTPAGGLSGGVAILTRDTIPLFRGSGSYDSRWIRASIPWSRSKTLQVICLYGFDVGANAFQQRNSALHRAIYQELHMLGRAPYVIGGDWNLSPEQLLPTWQRPGCAVATGESTCDTGSQLDWFMVSPVMAPLATTTLCHAPVAVHRPVLLHLRHHWLVDLGWRVVTPLPFKEAANDTERPTTVTLQEDQSLEAYWSQWTTGWEKYLTEWHGVRGGQFLGRGKPLRWARNTVGAKQHKQDGSALNAAAQRMLLVLNRVRRIRILLRVRPAGFEQELKRLYHLVPQAKGNEEGLYALLSQEYQRKVQQLRKERGALWKTWVDQMWAANPGKVFKWIKKLDSDEGMAGLHWGEYGAPADIPTRVDKAWKEWTAYWQVKARNQKVCQDAY